MDSGDSSADSIEKWLQSSLGFEAPLAKEYADILKSKHYNNLAELTKFPPTREDLRDYGFKRDKYFNMLSRHAMFDGPDDAKKQAKDDEPVKHAMEEQLAQLTSLAQLTQQQLAQQQSQQQQFQQQVLALTQQLQKQKLKNKQSKQVAASTSALVPNSPQQQPSGPANQSQQASSQNQNQKPQNQQPHPIRTIGGFAVSDSPPSHNSAHAQASSPNAFASAALSNSAAHSSTTLPHVAGSDNGDHSYHSTSSSIPINTLPPQHQSRRRSQSRSPREKKSSAFSSSPPSDASFLLNLANSQHCNSANSSNNPSISIDANPDLANKQQLATANQPPQQPVQANQSQQNSHPVTQQLSQSQQNFDRSDTANYWTQKLQNFLLSPKRRMVFTDLNEFERQTMHELAESLGLEHSSRNENGYRVLEVAKNLGEKKLPVHVKPPDNYATSHFNSRLHLVRKKNKQLREANQQHGQLGLNNASQNQSNSTVQNFQASDSLAVTHNHHHGRPRSLSQDGADRLSPRERHGNAQQQGAMNSEGFAKIQGEINRTPNTLIFRDEFECTKELIITKNDQNFKKTPDKAPNSFRYVNWNIEWMDKLFSSDSTFRTTSAEIRDVKGLLKKIAGVLIDINADVVAVLEGPSNIARMSLFCSKYLADGYHVFGGIDGGEQRVYILVNKNGAIKKPKLHQDSMSFLQKSWWFDVSGNFDISEYNFTRVPVAVIGELTVYDKVQRIYFYAIHTKSKLVQGGEALWKSLVPSNQIKFIQKAVNNRRRITGELARLRQCIEKVMDNNDEAMIIVSGDLNDGPGMDFFEQYYLLHDSLTALLGSPFQLQSLLHSTLLEKMEDPDHLYTCIFEDYVDNIPSRKTLIDHILVSSSLSNNRVLHAGVAHDIFMRHTSGTRRGEYPSDHRPIYSDFEINPNNDFFASKLKVLLPPVLPDQFVESPVVPIHATNAAHVSAGPVFGPVVTSPAPRTSQGTGEAAPSTIGGFPVTVAPTAASGQGEAGSGTDEAAKQSEQVASSKS